MNVGQFMLQTEMISAILFPEVKHLHGILEAFERTKFHTPSGFMLETWNPHSFS